MARDLSSDTESSVFFSPIIVLAILGTLLLIRIIALTLDPNSLYADETQYWLWAQSLDWGYFSKPPMIAWLIATTTGAFGDADWAVRLSAPFLHTITAIMLGLTASRLFDARVGAVTALAWATIPAVWLSSTIISTDAVLMVGVSTGLYALVRLREGADWKFALILGAAAGYAFLSKYAAIYLLIGLGLSIVVDAPARRALLSMHGLIAVAVFGIVISGNVIWNAQNEFATVSHTAANANWNPDKMFRPHKAVEFITDQLGVVGPAFFVVLLAAMTAAFRTAWPLDFNAARPRLMLALFAAPVLIIVTAQSYISRAHGNWAAVAYAAGIILIITWLFEGGRWRRYVLVGSFALHTVAGLSVMVLAASPSLAEAVGVANAFKRVRGWPETVQAVELIAQEAEITTLVYDNRNDFHQMQRYGQAQELELFAWQPDDHAQNYAEQFWPLPDGFDGPVLVISERPWLAPRMAWDFAQFEQVDEIVIDLGGDRYRDYVVYHAQGYERRERDAAYYEAVRALPLQD